MSEKTGLEKVAKIISEEYEDLSHISDGCLIDEPALVSLDRAEVTEEAWERMTEALGPCFKDDREYAVAKVHLVIVNADQDTCDYMPPRGAEKAE